MSRPTVALLPARGEAIGFPGYSGRYKALLPINGRPLIDYNLQALQNSQIERIFIIQSPDEKLSQTVTPNNKNVFVDCIYGASSLAGSLACGAEAILDYYGEKTATVDIMATPCDIPLAKSTDYDELIRQYGASIFDIGLVGIPTDLLTAVSPSRHWRSLYLRDLGKRYTSQAIAFARGNLVGFDHSKGKRRLTVLDGGGKPLQGLEQIVDNLRYYRGGFLVWPVMIYQLFLRRLSARGHFWHGFRLVSHALRGETTISELSRLFSLAFNLKFGLLSSAVTAFSLDVDQPADLKVLSAEDIDLDAEGSLGIMDYSQG